MAAVVQSVSAVAFSTSGGNLTLAKPTGTAEGDYLVAVIGSTFIVADSPTTLIGSPPSGWTARAFAYDKAGQDRGIEIWTKPAGASEPSSYEFAHNAQSVFLSGAIARISGQHATTPFVTGEAAAATGGAGTSGAMPSVSIGGSRLVLSAALWTDNTAGPLTIPSGTTEVVQGENSSNPDASLAIVSQAYGSSGSTSTNSWTASTSETWAVATIAIQEAASGHAVTPTGIAAGAPVVGAPALGQQHVLAIGGMAAAAPVAGAPALAQEHGLTAAALVAGAAVPASPALAQEHLLEALGVATAAPAVGAPALAITHVLAAADIAGAAALVGAPVLGQEHVLAALAVVTGSPVVPALVLAQEHALDAIDLVAAAAVPGTLSLSGEIELVAAGLVAATAVVGSPALAQGHALAAVDLVAGAALAGSPALLQEHGLAPLDLAAASAIAALPALGQEHALLALPVAVGAPVVGMLEVSIDAPALQPTRDSGWGRMAMQLDFG